MLRICLSLTVFSRGCSLTSLCAKHPPRPMELQVGREGENWLRHTARVVGYRAYKPEQYTTFPGNVEAPSQPHEEVAFTSHSESKRDKGLHEW